MTFAREEEEGGDRIGEGLRADGDVKAFIEDDLRTGAPSPLPWIFGTFLPFSLVGIAAGMGREGQGEKEGRETGRAEECY